jgi:hypothetical protein
MTREDNFSPRSVRNFAQDRGLDVRSHKGRLQLQERTGARKQLGIYLNWPAVHAAIERYGADTNT